ncbi:MAG: glutaredoxin family protein [Neisseriaceae bacterium]|nr:glutaredoxin family protein [Neisseriaceae bacterium]
MKLTILTREYCSLCHAMFDALQIWQQRYDFTIEKKEVDDFPQLVEKYDELVPVLLDENGVEICHWHLDENALVQYLDKNKPN